MASLLPDGHLKEKCFVGDCQKGETFSIQNMNIELLWADKIHFILKKTEKELVEFNKGNFKVILWNSLSLEVSFSTTERKPKIKIKYHF